MSYIINENVPLAPYCSIKAGGVAKYFIQPKSSSELSQAIRDCRLRGVKYIVVGNCSNLLFSDSGFNGAVIDTTGIKGLTFENGIITAQCGETLNSLARFACENSCSGFEFCYGIPGTIGGGVFMNAGAYGGDISQRFLKGVFLDKDLNEITLTAEEMDFGYRKSRLVYDDLILVSASFKTEKGDKDEIRKAMDELMANRKASQPLEFPSCGSAFKRPVGNFAAALIDQCGLKGFTVGGAQVSEKHAGFVINRNNATAKDIETLMDIVAKTVLEKTGVVIEPEIRIIK